MALSVPKVPTREQLFPLYIWLWFQIFWFNLTSCMYYIITHEPALSRSTALLRMAVRSLMAQEKNMSASQPHSFLLRSLYHDSHLRCLPLLTQLSWSPFAVRHKSASSFLAHLRSLYHIFLYSSSAISSVFSQNICSQMCAQVTGFCRCFAFQIGKICNQNCSVRNFQFRKFLPVNSYEHAILCKQNFIENRY